MEYVECVTCGQIPSFQPQFPTDPAAMAQVLDYLRCNTWPPESYSSVFNEKSPQITQYDNEIHRLEERLDKLRAERCQLTTYVDACRALFSPVRRLPNELLENIFDMCAPPSAHKLSFSDTPSEELTRLAKGHLLQLSQVCSRWHKIALETPRLWSEIVVDTSLWVGGRASPKGCLKLLEQTLKRSGSCPLAIEFCGELDGPESAKRLLIEHAERWKTACIEAPVQTLRNLGNLPLLETLHIVDEQDGDGSAVTFGPAPRLKCFKFNGNASSYPNLPWSQIEAVTIRAVPFTPVHVSSAVSLINNMAPDSQLELELFALNVPLPLNLPSAVSDILTLSLVLSGETEDYNTTGILRAILEALTLQKLQFLQFHRDCHGLATPHWPSDTFSAFVRRSSLGDYLIELHLHLRITDEQLLECLALLPSLRALVISDCTPREWETVLITDTLLRGLTLNADSETSSGRLIPALHVLRMSSLFGFTEDVYLELLQSRLESGRMEDVPFQARLYFMAPYERALSSAITSRIDALVREDRMGFMTGQDSEIPPYQERQQEV